MGPSHRIISEKGCAHKADIKTDDLLGIVVNSRRRFVLNCLLKEAKPIAITDLATELTEREKDIPKSQISKEQVKIRSIDLHHVQIPKMVAVGLLSRNQDTNTVELVDGSEALVSELV